ncbi:MULTISPECIES: hypothetical protein [unclassified Micromonospora]|uniref:hypothetical protein n=1 Tax=unclassified Micromonospora TaxID=2617518 RepID=UPI003642C451
MLLINRRESRAGLTLVVAIPGAYAVARLRFFGRRRVSLPLAAPSIMAVALYDFMIAWNEYLFALLFLVDRPDRWTVSLGLSLLADGVECPRPCRWPARSCSPCPSCCSSSPANGCAPRTSPAGRRRAHASLTGGLG